MVIIQNKVSLMQFELYLKALGFMYLSFMERQSSFLIYDAAAGSGKTFTLVKEFIKQLLQANHEGYYKHLLAITFTNKAVDEMKQRIIETLEEFSTEKSDETPSAMMLLLSEETTQSLQEIQKKSKAILKHLLHNYASFSVETIDGFNHRLIRTFARDLKLAANFEVTLDTPALLTEAVDSLLSKAGDNPEITKVLLDFALAKTDDEKSWDISRDIIEASRLLYDENFAANVAVLKQKTLEDFAKFRKDLYSRKISLSEKIETLANDTLKLIEVSGLEHTDFMRGTLPNHFLKLAKGEYAVYSNKLQENLEDGKSLYKVKAEAFVSGKIDSIRPIILANYLSAKESVHTFGLYDSILTRITPLSVINLVYQEIEIIKQEKNLLPISEFNALINTEIKNQPAPFIYERMGEKYRHFYIDEFQDTSLLQWENITPLIDNALSQSEDSQGSLLLVGDAKQSIYRWRGGLPEQFMGLYNDDNPFSSQEKEVLSLKTNFRSCEEIVNFNNDLFTFISSYFQDPNHSSLYKSGNKQKLNSKKEGYVKLEFIDAKNKEEAEEEYATLVYDSIIKAKEQGFVESDICILTRRKAEGIAIASYLLERNIPVVSSESLLLKFSPLVQILENSLILSLYPNNEEVKINLLDLVHNHLHISEEKHGFFMKFLDTSNGLSHSFSDILKDYGVNFDYNYLRTLSLYEGFEYCIQGFNLASSADAYLFGFMDLVFEFEQQPLSDKFSFLDYWEIKKDSASIAAGEGTNAIQLMTIHKAKGLEFPIVIFPFADIQLYDAKRDYIWYPLHDAGFEFTEAQINFKSDIENYSETGKLIYDNHRSQLELDSINLLYVTLTRAVEKLYIFSKMPKDIKDGLPTCYNHLFMEFLKLKDIWNPEQQIYEFGADSERQSKRPHPAPIKISNFISSSPSQHNLRIVDREALLWNTQVEIAITAGNLLHDTMAKIFSQKDAHDVIQNLKNRNIIPESELDILETTVQHIITHKDISHLYKSEDTVYNERDIFTSDGRILRPDRINIDKSKIASIIDYKTGSPQVFHKEQLLEYADALTNMGYTIAEKILIYTDKDEILINKV